MLVYGDPEFRCSLEGMLQRLRKLLNGAQTLEGARSFLIQAGQLEQALEDHAESLAAKDALCAFSRELTDKAAANFLEAASSLVETPAASGSPEIVFTGLQLLKELEKAGAAGGLGNRSPDLLLSIKIPEGYQFYSLYPEQYATAAAKWAKDHRETGVLVVGIRSIGTGLSAVVCEVLRFHGFETVRVTVRPKGHPFERWTQEEAFRRFRASHPTLSGASALSEDRTLFSCALSEVCGLIVDEGPGMSGSSMAGVKTALEKQGCSRITFLPGHDKGPGARASLPVRNCWKTTPQIVVPVEQVRWSGASLEAILLAKGAEIAGVEADGPLVSIGGGAWRSVVFRQKQDWSPATGALERAKYLWTGQDGRRLIWKFNGLGAAQPAETSTSWETLLPCQVSPLGTCNGFTVFPWVEGIRPTSNAAAQWLEVLARYCAKSVAGSLPPPSLIDGVRRLSRMIEHNLRGLTNKPECLEFLRAAALEKAQRLAAADGRMGPWEWVLTNEEHPVKTDYAGHFDDHTLIGPQSLLWDIAGTIVEWEMPDALVGRFIRCLSREGVEVDEQALAFYIVAYCAFRQGACSMCGDFGAPSNKAKYLAKASQALRSNTAVGRTNR